MTQITKTRTALVTGSAGFIGFHVAKQLLNDGWKVIGVDNLCPYYDVQLKRAREDILLRDPDYISYHSDIEIEGFLFNIFERYRPEAVIHLAAQAGVRNSIKDPRSYLSSNIIGTFELLEAARSFKPSHILLASTSSVYGANDKQPYNENDKTDRPISFYAATKKSTENIAYCYSHLYDLPVTVFRFFTVYGPWGRPDMALFKFTKAIKNNDAIDVYNYGKMKRDFTYIDDLVACIMGLLPLPPHNSEKSTTLKDARFRAINIGNNNPIHLLRFIQAIENVLDIKARMNFLPLQDGDVVSTWADNKFLMSLIG